MENDTFEFINGYENLYKINRNGEIYSCLSSKIMKTLYTSDVYGYIQLTKEGTRKKCRIHRLLALQWIPNPDNLPEVDHIDRNTKNNSLENLRWVDRKTNRCNQNRYDECRKPEVIETKKEAMKEYKTKWAEQDRRNKGCLIKSEMVKTKDPNYKNDWAKAKKEKETEEEKDERLRKRRERYANKEQSEEQKQKARERAQKQRDKKKENN
jgi:hypothetical protein